MRNNRRTCELATHFNETEHALVDFTFICIEQILDSDQVDRKLLARESYWMAQLRTLQPYGLNKRQEYKSKNRVFFTS